MKHRFLSASRIHDGRRFLPEGSVLEVAEDGTIIAAHGAKTDTEVAYFEGILTPGFVNVHCHLELSHMKGMIPERTGLIPFLQTVTRQRAGFSDEQKETARHQAYNEMLRNGVVAVGDVANTTDTLDVRALGSIHVHTFIEAIGFTESAAASRLAYAADIQAQFAAQSQSSDDVLLQQSIVPHAPYSVSSALFEAISAAEEGSLLCIHNQESEAEDEYYRSKTGAVRDLLTGFAIDDSFFMPTGKSSLQTYLPLISENHPVVFVHNTFTNREDMSFAQSRAGKVFWCLCPGANLYIEGRLPDVCMMADITDNICIGTDSLASNHQLSVLVELQLLKAHFPQLSWETLLRWATMNGAAALQMESIIGSFEEGKKPGIIHITSLEQHNLMRRII